MTEHQKETAFLRRMILFGDTKECRKAVEEIAELQRNERCIRRAMLLMTVFAALSSVALSYGEVLQENFPYGMSPFVMALICGIGLAALICLVVFSSLLVAYRRRLNRLREECRGLITKLLESQLGKSPLTPLRETIISESMTANLVKRPLESKVLQAP
jgi:hypothetical protein